MVRPIHEISPTALAARMAAGDAPRLIDVRERHEHAIAAIPGAELMPLSEIADWWRTLDPSEELVFHCHHGQRSGAVCRALAAEGFTHVVNLTGGIEGWRTAVDPSMAAY